MRKSKPFLQRLMSLTSSKEDVLTEFFVESINQSQEFRVALTQVFGLQSEIQSALPQVAFPGTNCVPDMLLKLQNGDNIIVENKIDASETKGSESDPRNQLERYLDLPASGLIYIRRELKSVSEVVANSNKFIIPKNLSHFIWNHIYQATSNIDQPLVKSLREGLDALGLSDAPFFKMSDAQIKASELIDLVANQLKLRSYVVERNKHQEIYITLNKDAYIFIPFRDLQNRYIKSVNKLSGLIKFENLSQEYFVNINPESTTEVAAKYLEVIEQQIHNCIGEN